MLEDIDGDGRSDILVAEQAGEGRLMVFRNAGAGQFEDAGHRQRSGSVTRARPRLGK
ncbi:MAG: hypothetical protein DMG57_39900 [Acidobacteria bacterium]|nr:MAG: hypothetical protein DMG57_39900 [Acidobacteriota bacterium]